MKKWTYLVAAGMLLGAAPVFTGCIDNDEPEGITILRGAKAELLKAKAAVEAAKVAQVQAEAALLQAQAKYQEALAVTEAANAKIKEAIAKQEEAKAALLETQNEQAKQELQAAIAELEHQKEMWEIEKNNALTAAEQAAKMWELSYKQAEVEYEKALVELESKKTALTNEQLIVLNQYISDVKTAKNKLAKAQKALTEAERAMKKAADLVEEREADKEYWQYEYARKLKLEQYALEGAKAAKERAAKELTYMEGVEATDLGAKLEETIAESKDLYKQYLDAFLKGAEERYAIENEYAAWMKKYQSFFDNTQTALHTIPEFTFPEDVKNEALPFAWEYVKTWTIPEATYSLSNPTGYDNYIDNLENFLYIIKRWTRDDNDNAWTSQSIAEWKKEIEELEASIETDKKAWKEAVDAYYRTPADAVIDLSKFTGYTEFAEALPAFNKAVEENEAAWDAVEKAQTDYYNMMAWEGVYYTNIRNLRQIKSDKEEALNNSYNEKYAEFETEYQEEYEELYNNWLKLEEDYFNGVEGVTWEQVEAAREACYNLPSPWERWNEYSAAEQEKIDLEYNEGVKAEKEAWNKVANDYKTALDTYNTKRAALDAQANAIAPLYDAFVNSATEGNISAILNVVDFMDCAGVNYGTIINRIYTQDLETSNDDAQLGTSVSYKYHSDYICQVEIGDAAMVNKGSMRDLIAKRSEIIFGYYYGNGENAYGDPDSRLLDLTYDDVKAAIEEIYDEPLYGERYINVCEQSFGKMGAIMGREARIEFAENWIADKNSSVNKLITAVTSAITSLEEEYTTLKEAADLEEKDLMDELTGIEIKYEQTYDAANELYQKYGFLLDFLDSMRNVCQSYIQNGFEFWTTDMIANEIERLQKLIKNLELEIEDQQHAVDTAQRNLEAYNDEQLTNLQILTEAWQDAITDVNNANDEYKAALELLKAIIDKMSLEVSDDTTTTEPAE